MQVLIDLHGAPGSQNGFDNSGRRGSVNWLEGDNVERSKDVLEALATWVEAWLEEGSIRREAVYGIELLNEPAGFREDVWRRVREDFYPDGYDRWGS